MAVVTDLLSLCLLTADGIRVGRVNSNVHEVELHSKQISGENIRSVGQDPLTPERLFAATVTDLFVSEDAGDTWKWLPAGDLDVREIWCMSVHPTRQDEIYVGTRPAAVYVSEDGGLSFHELTTFRQLPDYEKWTYPPPPHSPSVRKILLDARFPDEITVGVEEGGVVRSRDRGATWEDISGPPSSDVTYPSSRDMKGPRPEAPIEPGRVYRDVHEVMRDPAGERLYASTGKGLFSTTDDGRTWSALPYGIENVTGYTIPMAAHADRPGRIYVGFAASGPRAWKGYRTVRPGPFNSGWGWSGTSDNAAGAGAAVLRSDDYGRSWRVLADGLPPAHTYMVCGLCIDPGNPDAVFAAYTDGSVYASSDEGDSWNQLLSGEQKLFGIAAFRTTSA